ncbi:Ig-like domain-containing protein [Thermococcus aggregans]|uniref:Ig-like domain-containing protein n=1 Tax=Thermococcus aggregans TaxID=110163 RepID=A0A9E7MZR6_THEAG|nr:Ig-like domain-containing protein [Thermococcus aggregans]USS41780.1 Ig-like domain-containing protein [Thermococcus aggregans]
MRVAALIILTLLIFSGFGLAMERHLEYEKAYENDKGIYIHFRIILLYSEMALDKVIAEDNESIYYANSVEAKLNTTREEVEFYKSFGIESKVEKYLPPFLELGNGLKKIALGQRLFLDNIEVVKEMRDYYAYVNATLGLEMVKEGISSAEKALDVIDTFEFVDEDNSTLTLDTSSLREKLEKIKKMYSGYERVLSAYKVLTPEEVQEIIKEKEKNGEPIGFEEFLEENQVVLVPASITLYASNLNPYVYENVTFYGYAPGFENVYLHIENQTIALRVKGGRFSYVYSFDKVGKYEVFATGLKNGSVVKSNVLVVNVLKVPTKIVLSSRGSAYVNESITVKGLLLDYYGRPLKGEEVFGEFDGERFSLVTSSDGRFSFNVTSNEAGKKLLNVTYIGSEIYAGSSASLGVVFLEYPVETVGGEEEAENTVNIGGTEFSIFELILFVMVLVLFGGIGYLARKVYIRRRRGISDEEFVKLLKALEEAWKIEEQEVERKLKSFREMYREVYEKLIKHYGLKPSLTPRELVNRLRKEAFAYHLEKVTVLYEKHFYGKKPLRRREVLDYLRHIAGLIVSFIVREEL